MTQVLLHIERLDSRAKVVDSSRAEKRSGAREKVRGLSEVDRTKNIMEGAIDVNKVGGLGPADFSKIIKALWNIWWPVFSTRN